MSVCGLYVACMNLSEYVQSESVNFCCRAPAAPLDTNTNQVRERFFYNVLLDKKERRRRKKKKSFSHKNLKTSGLRAEREHAHFSSAPHFFYCRQESLHHAASRCYGPLVCQKAAKKIKAEQTEEPEGNNAPWSESRQEPLFNHIPLRIIAKVD